MGHLAGKLIHLGSQLCIQLLQLQLFDHQLFLFLCNGYQVSRVSVLSRCQIQFGSKWQYLLIFAFKQGMELIRIFVPEWLNQLMLQLRAFRHPSLPENFVVFDLPIQLLYEIVWSFLTFAVDFNSLYDTNSPVCRCHSIKSTGLTCLRSNWTEVTLPGAASGWYTIRFNLDCFISVLARALVSPAAAWASDYLWSNFQEKLVTSWIFCLRAWVTVIVGSEVFIGVTSWITAFIFYSGTSGSVINSSCAPGSVGVSNLPLFASELILSCSNSPPPSYSFFRLICLLLWRLLKGFFSGACLVGPCFFPGIVY